MRIKILVRLKGQILEPQGKVIEQSLNSLGFTEFSNIRQGKLIELDLPEDCLIAGVTRRDNTYIPSGTWKFAEKDKLVVFTLPESIEKIEETFC